MSRIHRALLPRSRRRPPSRALLDALFAALAALLAAASVATVSAGAAASSPAPTPAPTQVGVPREVNVRQLPAGTGSARLLLPRMRPDRAGSTALSGAPARAAAVPATVHAGTSGFAGDSFSLQTGAYGGAFGDNALVPPDNGTAANGAFVVEMLNDSGWIYLRNSGSAGAVKSFDLNVFFRTSTSAGACNGYCVSDPRVVWDGSHWFASALAFNSTLNSEEFVAVTTGADPSDPTGTWRVYMVWNAHSAQVNDPCNAPSVPSCLGDQPRLGVTSDKVALFWDDYASSNTGPFLQEEAMVMDKSALTSGATLGISNSQDIRNVAPPTGNSACWFGVVPAYLSTGADLWAVYNDTDSLLTQPACSGDGKVHVVRFSGSASSVSPVDTALTVTSATTGGAGLVAPQPAPGGNINADDDRVTVAAISGSNVVATANSGCTFPGDATVYVCVRTFEFSVATASAPALSGNAAVGAQGHYYYYGAPAFDGSGNLAVVMSGSDASTDPGVSIAGASAGALAAFSAPAALKAGAQVYQEVGFGECDLSQSCRWGDYSGAQTDPCDPSFVWTSAEYATSDAGTNWGTWISPVTFGGSTAPAVCAGAPAVTSVSPSTGPPGTAVTITGSGFTGATHAYFGTADAASLTVDSDSQITAAAPAGAATVDVTVVTSSGQSAPNSGDHYTLTGPPAVSGVSPDTGPGDGVSTETVTITGANFGYPATVWFGSKSVPVNGGGGNTATTMVVTSPAATPQVVNVRVSDAGGESAITAADQFVYTDGGYTMDAYGGLHPFGVSVAPPARRDGPYWPGWRVARAHATRADRGSGYVLDSYGGVHPYGGAPSVITSMSWGSDFARDIAIDPCDPTGGSGYVLDANGGLHPFGPGGQAVSGSPSKFSQWPGWDIAHSIVLNSCGQGGYVMDDWGGLHPFQLGSGTLPSLPSDFAYWPDWYVARGVALTADGRGYTLDAFGGVHAFGGATTATGFAYWGWDIARGITVIPGSGGYTLDGYGGVHPFSGAAPAAVVTGYGGTDIYRTIR